MVEACHNLACRRHGTDRLPPFTCLNASSHEVLCKAQVWHIKQLQYLPTAPMAWRRQGAADAALCYIVLSDMVINTYHTKITPTGLTDPLRAITILHSLKAFIDDVVLHASDRPHAPFQALLEHTSAQVQWWDQLVKVTGGSLNTKKCCAIAYK